jgi:hypothetical protein
MRRPCVHGGLPCPSVASATRIPLRPFRGSSATWKWSARGFRLELGQEGRGGHGKRPAPCLREPATPASQNDPLRFSRKKAGITRPFPLPPGSVRIPPGSPQQRPTNPLIAPRSIAQWHRQSIARPSYMLRRPVHLAPQVQQAFQSLKGLPPSAGDRSAAPSLDPDRLSPTKARRIRISK